ncbi:MAG: 8-oxo-dGTP diphosphatase [Bdellovibrionales bacterium]|nr:8-oxo-dGTP diphosphatase [Bdellovibrionales bacterium]
MMKLATLCYVRSNGRTLMLERGKRPGDIHQGKWNGLGGKLDPGETPEECVIREVREESGLTIEEPRLRGILTFPAFKDGEDWYVFVFTAEHFEGEVTECAEGRLAWIADEELLTLPLWEGDHFFLPWLFAGRFFSARFRYQEKRLVAHNVVFHPPAD